MNPCRDQIWGKKFDEAATKAGVATPDATSAPFENMSSAATAIAEADPDHASISNLAHSEWESGG